MTSAEMVVVGMKHIVCFSGGHSSAIAAVEVVRKFGAEDAILLNHDLCPRTEDADIKRFKKQVSDYLGVPITYANMPGWDVKDQFDVCMEIKAFKAGAQSTAFCTNRLKTEPFHKWLSEHYPANPPEVRDDISLVYGFDANEQHRIRRRVGIMAAMGYQTEYPLTWEVRTIHDIEEVGIERPKTYSIFNHANCTGCLKAGKQHWFVVYCLYPKIWEKAKLAEDTIGYSILKQGYLSDFEAEFAKLKFLIGGEKMEERTYLSGTSLAGMSPTRSRVENDYYATPFEATEAILSREELHGSILEPAAGEGHISKVLLEHYPNSQIISTDLVQRDDRFGCGIVGGVDFLTENYPEKFNNVITNPPFSLAKEFAEKALEVSTGKVILFAKIQFLEGRQRKDFFATHPPKAVYVFSKRVNPLRNGLEVDENGKPWSSTMCFAWFVWEHGYTGEPCIRWI